jgi:hypothetical protein
MRVILRGSMIYLFARNMANVACVLTACAVLSGCISSVKKDDNLRISVGDTLVLANRGIIYECELHLSTIGFWLAPPGKYKCLGRAPVAEGEIVGERGEIAITVPAHTRVRITKIQVAGMLDASDTYVHLRSDAWRGRIIVTESAFPLLFSHR